MKSLDIFLGASWFEKYFANPEGIVRAFSGTIQGPTMIEALWRGGLPRTMFLDQQANEKYRQAYLRTYIERDARMLGNIDNLTEFSRFVGLVSALSSQEVNYSQLGREVGIDGRRAKAWLRILQHSYLWREALPFFNNSIKRLSKKAKGYFFDTGILCSLHSITTPRALASHPMLGSVFETWVANMIHQLNIVLGTPAKQYHWRSTMVRRLILFLSVMDGCFRLKLKLLRQ